MTYKVSKVADKKTKINFNSAIPLNLDTILRSMTIIAELLAE